MCGRRGHADSGDRYDDLTGKDEEVRMALSYFPLIDPPKWAKTVCEIDLTNRYDSRRHSLATKEVEGDLKRRKICRVDSIVILNALWDAVFDSEGYANEMAAFLSLQS